jgi:hypothetical protein
MKLCLTPQKDSSLGTSERQVVSDGSPDNTAGLSGRRLTVAPDGKLHCARAARSHRLSGTAIWRRRRIGRLGAS